MVKGWALICVEILLIGIGAECCVSVTVCYAGITIYHDCVQHYDTMILGV